MNIPMKKEYYRDIYTIFHLKAFGMISLHYEIRVGQNSIIESQLTIKVNVWYEIEPASDVTSKK